MKEYMIGVIGGLGPLATAKFIERVINLTDANCDQENVDMIILNHASVPDRTDYLLDNNKENPLPYLIKDAKLLENIGCSYIAIPCNTAHAFLEYIEKNINIKLINMVKLTIDKCNERNMKKVGLMATRGTIKTNIFDKYSNIELFKPNEDIQNIIDKFIFDRVKKNKNVSLYEFNSILDYFYKNECDGVILGCTELSVIKVDLKLNDSRIVDTLDVLAHNVIKLSGKKIKQGEK